MTRLIEMKHMTGTFVARAVLIILFLQLYTGAVYCQDEPRYSMSFDYQPLKQILKEITGRTGYKFAYSDTELQTGRSSSFSVQQATLSDLLDDLCGIYSLEAEVIGRTIVLTPVDGREGYTVRGRVTDLQTGQPLEWVNITSSDLRHGTLTDSTGHFLLRTGTDSGLMQFSFVGYRTATAAVSSDTVLSIRLEEDIRPIREIVVVAFGKENKDLITGAVSVIEPEIFSGLNNATMNSTLQTNVSGVLVQNNAGTPGSAINVTIRGISSITAGNQPLYILDGIPMIRGNFSQLDFSGQTIDAVSDLNVNDIASITLLKDAAASSLYGASASNGVVLITTKQGVARKNQVQFDTYYGLQQTTGKLDMLNARQWMKMVNEESLDEGGDPVYSASDIQDNTVDTDWLDEVFRTAPVYNAYLSFRGGTDNSSYYLSGNYFNQEGIVIGSDFSRYSFRVNYDYQYTDKLSFEVGNGFSYSQNNRVEGDQSLNGPLPVGISMPPIYPVYNADESYNNDGPYANPVSIANEEKNLATTYRNIFNFAVNYDLFRNLRLRSQTGFDYYHLGEETFAPKTTRQGAKYNGLGIEATNNALLFYNSTFLNWSYTNGLTSISILAGGSFDTYREHGTFLRAQNFPGNSFEFLQVAANPIIASSDETDAVSNSLFGSVKYNFGNTYLFSLNLRRDGSSKFGENNRFGYFPAVSGMWYISNGKYWDEDSPIKKLKLRASYGLTGNDQINDFISLDLFSAGSNYGYEAGIHPYQLSNPRLKWETTSQLNTGLEIGFTDRFSIRADYYLKRTRDLLLEVPVPTSSGFSFFISNVGRIQNQGIETEVHAVLVDGALNWSTSLSLTANRNKVIQLYQDQPIRNIGRASSSIEVDQPVSYFYGFIADGVDPQTGLLIYRDIHEDGVINDMDRTFIGSPYPDLYGGWMHSLGYRNLHLDFLLYFSYGNEIFNSTRLYTETISIGNQTTAVLDRWKAVGDETDVPRASSYNERTSSRFVEDGSFLRLKSIKLSLEMGSKLPERMGMEALEVYLAGKNLFTLTRYSGMDPEVNYTSTSSIKLGTDFFTCPQPKSLILGVCATF
jgi:TonB-linked SusC/RagA family outer membrane protein